MSNIKQLNKHKNNKNKSEMKHKTLTFRFLDMSRGGFARLFLLLLLPCLSVIGVKAADSNGGVKVTFNSGVRYSQWAINSRANDFYANTSHFGLATYKADGTIDKPRNDTKKKLDYVPGLVAKSMIEAADYYQGFDWSKPWFLSVKEYGDAYDTLIPEDGKSFDDLNGTKIYIGINSNHYASADDKKMVTNALARVKNGFIKTNNNYVIPQGTLAEKAGKNVAGGWWHKSTYNNQMWLDGAYMGSALLAQLTQFYGNSDNVFGSKEADWNMVAKQLNIVWNMCWNSTDKLMYHAFDATATAKATDKGTATWYGLSSTEPYNFHSAAYWGRANAWYLYALVDVLEAMEADGQKGKTNYLTLKGHLDELAAGIAARQDAKNTGGWFQLLDKDGNFVSQQYNGTTKNDANYIETSATALFSAALFKAVRLGLLSTSPYDYKTVAAKAFEGLVNNFVTYDADGGIQIWGSCKSAGLSGKNYRDGSNEYYLSGSDVTMVKKGETTEGKVLGGFIMAATEYERAYQNQDSKQILFAKDLAPNYDFSTTEGKLDATAYGDGTITYQWYKDGNAIANAKSATYAPTENGSYYCEATDNSKTIQTSTTTVTTANTNTDNGSTDNNGGSDNGTTSTVLFSYDVPTTGNTSTSDIETTGGKIAYQNQKNTFSNDGYKIDNTTKYIKVTLTGNRLQQGDVISISINSTKGTKDIVAKDENGKSITLNNISSDKSTISYSVTASDILNGKDIFYLYKNSSSVYVKAIKITRANTQVALTASYSPATISATEGDVAQNLPTLTVKAGETTLTAKDYTVTYASNNDAVAKVENGKVSFVGKGETNIVATIKPTDTNKYKETSATFAVKVEKKQTPVTPTEGEVIYDFTGSIGTTTAGTSCTTANNVITFSSNFSANEGKYITIKPKTDSFKAGDVITLEGYCDSKNLSGVIIYSDVNGSSIFKSNVLAKSANGGSKFTYTIEKDCDALYLGRYGGGTTRLTSLKVERSASSSNKTRLTASFKRNADVVVNTTKNVTLPTLTVQAGNTTLSADQYTVVYTSNAEDVATLSGNTITIKSLGIATITATVTPKDANTYEGTTATYQLSVKAPSPLNVSVMDVTINTTDAEEEQPVIKVYGDNDKLLKLGQDYTLSFAVSGDNNVTVDNTTGKFSVTKNAGKFIKGTSLITVTATPTTSLGSNYTVGTLQFSYSVSEGKIKPVFSDSFKGITINLHQDDTNREIIVPLIYNGEDVSSYFKYTYKVTAKANGQIQEFTENTLNYTPSTAGTYTVTVSATPGQNGEDNYGDVYDSPDPISFNLDIKSTYQVITVTPDPTSIKMYAGTTRVAPDLTVVTNENATLADTEYNTSWFSTSPGVVKVDSKTGKIEAVSEGTANIRVVVTGENLESTTALITIDVDDPAVYRVHANEEYKSQKTMWNQDENLSVTLGGWLFPGTVGGLWTTEKESLSSTVEWNYDSSQDNYKSRKAPWKITGFDYMVKAGDKQKNARQEMGSNSMPETTLISNVDYTKKDHIVDPMFNVPCSGSFLVFQPKTNGTVVAHIYQNGVFDSKKNKNSTDYQYRPQRRVFIMDEAGNFVSSAAHIESTTGKPNGKNYNLSDYKWDMGDKQSPTVETVKNHFGLKSFEMSETGFKNNVYENQLGQEIAPNEAANKYPNLKGSRGWSVLADAPVTYTFKVKAGKTYYLYNFGSKIGFYGFSFDEDETKPVEDVVSYDDNTTNTIKTTEAGHVAKVTVNRKMTAGIWTTCVLPFSLNKHQVDAIFGNTYSIGNENGTQILYFDRVEGNKVFFVRHAYNTIVANKPFLIKPSKDVESISTAAATEYPYVTIEATKNENGKPDDWCTGNGYTWASSYSYGMTVKEGDGFISKDGLFKNFVGKDGTLKGFRGYLKRLNTQAGAKPIMLQVVNSSNVDGDNGETTGIEDLIIDADGQLMPANGKVYNINGQLVSEDANSFQSLPSGIYIINGKKYIK
jgi:rhamnogalacturonyl hydrolase YesR